MPLSPGSARPSAALLQFVSEELLRAPLLFDQMVDGVTDRVRKLLPSMTAAERTSAAELLQILGEHRAVLSKLFSHSLQEQVEAELRGRPLQGMPRSGLQTAKPAMLSLVDEDQVAFDVELAHTLELVKNVAEFELRELQTYAAALVGDMDVTCDHNPFRAETYARALWTTALGLPVGRHLQVSFMRMASEPLAMLLRQAYAASASRLERQGIEPAAYRTVIVPSDMRRSRSLDMMDSGFGPELHHVRDTLAAEESSGRSHPDASAHAGPRASGQPAAHAPSPATAPVTRSSAPKPRQAGRLSTVPPLRVDAQSAALVRRLFEAIRDDDRVPHDVLVLILRLQPAALRLAQVDADRLADESHALWAFVNRLAYEAEMMPRSGDPERMRFLRLAEETIAHLAGEPEQSAALYIRGSEQLESWSRQRLARRCAAAASQISTLQRLEDRLLAGRDLPTTLHGALDAPELDTVPASLLADEPEPVAAGSSQQWLDHLDPGSWLRLFLQGRWVHAQVLWRGERRDVWLLGDGATDTTWAVRRSALMQLFEAKLLKGLRQRSLVRRAAGVVQAQARAA